MYLNIGDNLYPSNFSYGFISNFIFWCSVCMPQREDEGFLIFLVLLLILSSFTIGFVVGDKIGFRDGVLSGARFVKGAVENILLPGYTLSFIDDELILECPDEEDL